MMRTVPFSLLVLASLSALSCGGATLVEAADNLTSSAVLVSADEPGTPLIITGTVFKPDGTTPLEGVELYVYHTDDRGYYGEQVMDNQDPRLKATIRTDAAGHYELRTIKPGPYPDGGVPAHVHYVASGGGYEKQSFELRFEGDPALGRRAIDRSAELGKFGSIKPLSTTGDGSLHCVHDLRMRD